VGVGAVVVRGDHVLLIRRAKRPRLGEWSLPGGLQKLGETVVAAVTREVMEETGVGISPLGVVDVVDLIEHDDEERVRVHYTLVEVAAAWVSGEPIAGGDAADARWVNVREVANLVAWSETVRIIRQGWRLVAAGGGARSHNARDPSAGPVAE
jgi:ADP-ribose pyrophosphatase YjhB (NUDIX family)